MKLKTFTADTMSQAMEMVRAELGPDAIIVSSYEGRRGRGVEIRAAVEAAPKPISLLETPRNELASFPVLDQLEEITSADVERLSRSGLSLSHDGTQILRRGLAYHGFSRKLGKALLSACEALATEELETTLTQIIELRFDLSSLALPRTKPLIVVGPPGVGKTAVTAKLAASAVMRGHEPIIVTTDTLRSGAVEQLASIVKLMDQKVHAVDTPQHLCEVIANAAKAGTFVIIDTPATNPFKSSETEDLKRFIESAQASPLGVVAAGGLWSHDYDTLKIFRDLGVRNLILTRMDATKRIGGALSAVDALGLTLTAYSDSPYIAQALRTFTPELLANRILKFE